MTLHQRDTAALLATYNRLPMEIAHGEGVFLVDTEGKRYLDFFGGLAVNALGYGRASVLEAQREQMTRFLHVSNLFPQRPQVELAELLLEETGMDRVFFANSGAETLEAAFKMLRRWGSQRGKSTIISFSGGFHGRTMAGLSMMDVPKYRDGFGPFLENCITVPFNDVASLQAAVDDDTIAVVYEPIQGEGGVRPLSEEIAAALKALQSRYGFLLVADEIQSGMGRTGSFLASSHWGLDADIVTLAKSLGGGLPLGALLLRESLSDVFAPGDHGSTFGGNPVACAGGVAVITELRAGTMENAERVGRAMQESFMQLKEQFPQVILEVRGMGCMQGLVCSRPAADIRDYCLAHGLLVNVTRDTVLRFLPPLIITSEHVDSAVDILRNAFQSWELV